ncbi:MAG: hypothetical protein NVS2B9_08420 [Myxococcales bacterium]
MIAGLARERLAQLYLDEISRARKRVDDLRARYPSAGAPELVQRLIDSKKTWASASGAISGLFGLASLPADLALVTALQLALIMEVALLHKVNLKSGRARDEVLEVLGYCNGADTVNLASRVGPKLLGKIAQRLLTRGGLETLGRAIPIVAAPVVAHFNNRDIQRAGLAAQRFYGTMRSLPARKPAPSAV